MFYCKKEKKEREKKDVKYFCQGCLLSNKQKYALNEDYNMVAMFCCCGLDG